MARFDFSQVAHWLSAEGPSVLISGFQHDSSLVRPGDLFFAIKGEKVDGHQFLEEAAKKGAVGAVVSKRYFGERFGLPCIAVDDVLKALQELARIVHGKRSTRVVAVTGSVGKTTTKEFLATLLEGAFRVAKTPGNANSQIGVALSLLNAEGDEEIFVVEMGMSQPGEIKRLVEIAPPEVALITKIALSHAEFFSDGLEGIARAKAEIFSHPQMRLGIASGQAMQYSAVKGSNCNKWTYSDSGETDFVLVKEGELFCVKERGESSPLFSLPFTATHLCENFLAAAVAARAFGMQWDQIFAQTEKLKVFKRRFERVDRNGIVFINDSYNANPASMRAALGNMPAPVNGGKKIAVLGEMKELGVFSQSSHLEVGQIALKEVDHLICLGEECLPMVELFQEHLRPVEFYQEITDVKRRVKELAQLGDVVLLKGSNSKRLWEVLEE